MRKPAAERLILGLGVFSHDTAVALLRGSEVLFASEQERFDRVKHSHACPVDAVAAALRWAGASFADLDDVVINYEPRRLVWSYLRHVWRYLPGSLRMLCEPRRYRNVLRARGYRVALQERFGEDSHLAWHAVGHHLAHAASAFYRSPFERAGVLTSDALGEFESVCFAVGEGNRLRVTGTLPYPHSLGAVYSAVTDHLGFEIYSGEGKVMGLAGWGKPNPAVSLTDAIRLLPGGGIEANLAWFRYHVLPFVHEGWTSRRFARRFGPRRKSGEPLGERHRDLAWALQELSDRVTLHLARHVRQSTGLPDLCYAGGSALNAYGNTCILRDSGADLAVVGGGGLDLAGQADGQVSGGTFRGDPGLAPNFRAQPEFGSGRLFVQPAANDAGTALGAALYHAHHTLGLPRTTTDGGTFLGPAFAETDVEKALRAAGMAYRRPADLAAETARLLASGRTVGWFQGRLEFGPRALGHRSILADPRLPSMQDHLNGTVKRRERFRPFAPIVPLEEAARFFDLPAPELPHMLFIVPVRPEWRERLPAVTHIDGTTRVQTVARRDDPLLWDLLHAFGREAGVPVLLNTSFNGPGEPIVCTPADALGSFRRLGLDALALGPFLVTPLGR